MRSSKGQAFFRLHNHHAIHAVGDVVQRGRSAAVIHPHHLHKALRYRHRHLFDDEVNIVRGAAQWPRCKRIMKLVGVWVSSREADAALADAARALSVATRPTVRCIRYPPDE